MRNFTGNPFLMVSERSGNDTLVKTSKNQFFGEIIDILEVVESRTTPNPTVVLLVLPAWAELGSAGFFRRDCPRAGLGRSEPDGEGLGRD